MSLIVIDFLIYVFIMPNYSERHCGGFHAVYNYYYYCYFFFSKFDMSGELVIRSMTFRYNSITTWT